MTQIGSFVAMYRLSVTLAFAPLVLLTTDMREYQGSVTILTSIVLPFDVDASGTFRFLWDLVLCPSTVLQTTSLGMKSTCKSF